MMKYLLVAILCLSAPAFAQTEVGVWKDGPITTNPATGTVLVDTGALDTAAQISGSDCVGNGGSGGLYLINAHVSSTIGAFFLVKVMDAGGVVLHSIYRGVGVNDSKDFMPRVAIQIPQNGKVQILTSGLPATFVGMTQATITYAYLSCY
jgi:hypothetical protein